MVEDIYCMEAGQRQDPLLDLGQLEGESRLMLSGMGLPHTGHVAHVADLLGKLIGDIACQIRVHFGEPLVLLGGIEKEVECGLGRQMGRTVAVEQKMVVVVEQIEPAVLGTASHFEYQS